MLSINVPAALVSKTIIATLETDHPEHPRWEYVVRFDAFPMLESFHRSSTSASARLRICSHRSLREIMHARRYWRYLRRAKAKTIPRQR